MTKQVYIYCAIEIT